MFNYCPACASKKIGFKINVFRCPDCGFVYYHNTAAATGCLILVPGQTKNEDRLVFTVRSKEPGSGKLDMPGGFVDPGEGILEGLYRELREEIGWTPPVPAGTRLTDIFKLYASFPNVYPYKGVDYNTCDMYFTVSAPGLTPQDINLEKAEISEIRFLRQQEINLNDFAFESTRRAVKAYFELLD
ncbi:MAG: NUDIX domain-containing protein [Treponema sp.]|jgi:ADP-ribose pyrophosphatase YjhB (NUDIX family)|nr:NUDIX domain-containing protein [Treponema sp.]